MKYKRFSGVKITKKEWETIERLRIAAWQAYSKLEKLLENGDGNSQSAHIQSCIKAVVDNANEILQYVEHKAGGLGKISDKKTYVANYWVELNGLKAKTYSNTSQNELAIRCFQNQLRLPNTMVRMNTPIVIADTYWTISENFYEAATQLGAEDAIANFESCLDYDIKALIAYRRLLAVSSSARNPEKHKHYQKSIVETSTLLINRLKEYAFMLNYSANPQGERVVSDLQGDERQKWHRLVAKTLTEAQLEACFKNKAMIACGDYKQRLLAVNFVEDAKSKKRSTKVRIKLSGKLNSEKSALSESSSSDIQYGDFENVVDELQSAPGTLVGNQRYKALSDGVPPKFRFSSQDSIEGGHHVVADVQAPIPVRSQPHFLNSSVEQLREAKQILDLTLSDDEESPSLKRKVEQLSDIDDDQRHKTHAVSFLPEDARVPEDQTVPLPVHEQQLLEAVQKNTGRAQQQPLALNGPIETRQEVAASVVPLSRVQAGLFNQSTQSPGVDNLGPNPFLQSFNWD